MASASTAPEHIVEEVLDVERKACHFFCITFCSSAFPDGLERLSAEG